MTHGKTLKSLLLAGAILAPATTLAVLGLRAYRAESLLLHDRYRQDQEAIVRLVAGRLTEAARTALEDLEARTGAHDPDATLEARFRAAHPMARHIFLLRRGRLVYPPLASTASDRGRERRSGFGHLFTPPARPTGLPLVSELDVNNYIGRLHESRRQGARVSRGIRAEYASRLAEARRIYRRASAGSTDPSAEALLGLARVDRRTNRVEDARQHLQRLRQRFGGRQDREGVSYALLSDAGLAEIGSTDLLLRMHDRLVRGEYLSSDPVRHFYLRWVLGRLARSAGSGQVARLRRVTSDLFAAERFGSLLNRHGVLELQQLASRRMAGVALDRRTILVLRQRKDGAVGYSIDDKHLARCVAQQQREPIAASICHCIAWETCPVEPTGRCSRRCWIRR